MGEEGGGGRALERPRGTHDKSLPGSEKKNRTPRRGDHLRSDRKNRGNKGKDFFRVTRTMTTLGEDVDQRESASRKGDNACLGRGITS